MSSLKRVRLTLFEQRDIAGLVNKLASKIQSYGGREIRLEIDGFLISSEFNIPIDNISLLNHIPGVKDIQILT